MKLNFRLWIEAFSARSDAYWISPTGEILPASITHIQDILRDPEKFGFTKEQLDAIAQKHGEVYGQEGKARNEVMIDAMNRGWIRIRKYHRPDVWSVQTGKFDSGFRRRLSEWMWKMLEDMHAHWGDDVRLTPLDGSGSQVVSFKEFIGAAA